MDGNIVSISHAHSVVCALLAHGIRCESIRFVLQTESRMLIAREHVDFSFLATNCHRRCSVVFIRKMPYMGLALVPVIRNDACVYTTTPSRQPSSMPTIITTKNGPTQSFNIYVVCISFSLSFFLRKFTLSIQTHNLLFSGGGMALSLSQQWTFYILGDLF